MTDLLPFVITSLVSLAAGGGVVAYLKSRPVTTKAMLLKALALEAEEIAKMPGAAADQVRAQQAAQDETLAMQRAQAAVAKAAGVPAQS